MHSEPNRTLYFNSLLNQLGPRWRQFDGKLTEVWTNSATKIFLRQISFVSGFLICYFGSRFKFWSYQHLIFWQLNENAKQSSVGTVTILKQIENFWIFNEKFGCKEKASHDFHAGLNTVRKLTIIDACPIEQFTVPTDEYDVIYKWLFDRDKTLSPELNI